MTAWDDGVTMMNVTLERLCSAIACILKSFRITDGRLSARAVDEVYCLTDVMLGCRIHLSPFSPEERYARESAGQDIP